MEPLEQSRPPEAVLQDVTNPEPQPHGDRRMRVAVIYGGRSAEHDISLISARFVATHLDPERYDVMPVAIGRDGVWRLPDGGREALAAGTTTGRHVVAGATTALVCGAPPWPSAVSRRELPAIDVVFPVLHGPSGEDGTIQGFLEMAGLPYVGAGVLGSSLGMDKIAQKKMFQAHGLQTAPFLGFTRPSLRVEPEVAIAQIEDTLGYPVFVKPANLGSSVGISKATDRQTLVDALEIACAYDRRIIVEGAIRGAHEVECAVIGNDDPRVSIVGEIRTGSNFYDYDAKYLDADAAQLIIPASIPKDVAARVRTTAEKAFVALDLAGMARVDCFAGEEPEQVWLNEVNTIPGFTSISMFPRLWEASGLTPGALVDELIRLAVERHQTRRGLKTDR